MRRAAAIVSGLLILLVVLPAVPAFSADTLEEYLAEAESAEYAGRRIVVTTWDGESEVGIYDVTHAGDVTIIGQTRVSSGTVAGDDAAVSVLEWSRAALADRYSVEERGSVERLGRSAQAIDIYEGDLVRASIVFDEVTGAPLLTQVYDGNGDLFRYSALLDFDDRPDLVYRDLGTGGRDYEVMLPVTNPQLPATAAGYTRTDTYRGADEWVHTFYSDGLFSFSVFEADGALSLSQFRNAGTFEAGGAKYDLIVQATEVWVTWRTADTTFVLVGDVPPDHLEQVLAELPSPDRPGFLKRLWRGLFG